MKALIVVDMQNDFISGTLAVPRAQEIVGPIQDLVETYKGIVVYTKCLHPSTHCSFKEYGGTWPAHCVVGTDGAKIQTGLWYMALAKGIPIYPKGMRPDVEQYSGFDNHDLPRYLKLKRVTDIEVCGLARDYCVKATAEAAERFNYRVTILEDLCRSVD